LVYDTLLATGNTKIFGKAKEMQMGMIAVLHTWGQQLSCIRTCIIVQWWNQ
jgi:hypothetical protein